MKDGKINNIGLHEYTCIFMPYLLINLYNKSGKKYSAGFEKQATIKYLRAVIIEYSIKDISSLPVKLQFFKILIMKRRL